MQAAKQLEGSGFERQQAEAVAAVVQCAQSDLATKVDLTAALKASEAALKFEMLKVAIAVIGLNAAIMFGLLRLFMGQA